MWTEEAGSFETMESIYQTVERHIEGQGSSGYQFKFIHHFANILRKWWLVSYLCSEPQSEGSRGSSVSIVTRLEAGLLRNQVWVPVKVFSILIGTAAQSTLIELILGALCQAVKQLGVHLTVPLYLLQQREFASRMKKIGGPRVENCCFSQILSSAIDNRQLEVLLYKGTGLLIHRRIIL
jgi:hypothetical protein